MLSHASKNRSIFVDLISVVDQFKINVLIIHLTHCNRMERNNLNPLVQLDLGNSIQIIPMVPLTPGDRVFANES